MIGRVLERVRPRVSEADAVSRSDETITVTVPSTGPARAARTSALSCGLRVRHEGRVGHAGSTEADPEALVRSAIESAAVGEREELFLPAPSPAPEVATADRAAASAGPHEVLELARLVRGRLPDAARDAEVWVERSAGWVELGNTRDVHARYDATLVGIGVRLPLPGERPAMLSLHRVGVPWPGTGEVDRLVTALERLVTPPVVGRTMAPPPGRVWFAPRAVRALLAPVLPALQANALHQGRSFLAGREHEEALPAGITLRDDPLVPLRPGSRPVDDDGVVCRPVTLVDRGRATGWICDLATGARLGRPSTGHGRRLPFAPPRAAYSNLVLDPGEARPADLVAETGEGILVELLPRPWGDLRSGRLVLATPYAYRVSDGAVVGRFSRCTLRGNLLEMLRRLVALGRDTEWAGAWCGPAMVLEGLDLAVE